MSLGIGRTFAAADAGSAGVEDDEASVAADDADEAALASLGATLLTGEAPDTLIVSLVASELLSLEGSTTAALASTFFESAALKSAFGGATGFFVAGFAAVLLPA